MSHCNSPSLHLNLSCVCLNLWSGRGLVIVMDELGYRQLCFVARANHTKNVLCVGCVELSLYIRILCIIEYQFRNPSGSPYVTQLVFFLLPFPYSCPKLELKLLQLFNACYYSKLLLYFKYIWNLRRGSCRIAPIS